MSTLSLHGREWLQSLPVRHLLSILKQDGGDARFVGGCVRDALLGRDVHDFDVATTLLPQEVIDRCLKMGAKVVPSGVNHGTVMVINEGRIFEITTLRKDIETNGRHAKVVFTDDWLEDAKRRDFTMNALYCDIDGNVTDFFCGLQDALAGRVRFVGDPHERIKEDVLRILRFYRFCSYYGQGDYDQDAARACRSMRSLLNTLSAERVRAELMRLFSAPSAHKTVELMEKDQIFDAMSLPLGCSVQSERAFSFPQNDPLPRLFSLIQDETKIDALCAQLRLSKVEKSRLENMRTLQNAAIQTITDIKKTIYKYGARAVRDALILRGETESIAMLDVLEMTFKPRFPLNGSDLREKGIPSGPYYAQVLDEIEAWWVDGDFLGDRAACLKKLDETVSETKFA